MKQGLLSSTLAWLKQPFSAEGSALSWVLFVGLIIIAAWMWNTVLLRIREV